MDTQQAVWASVLDYEINRLGIPCDKHAPELLARYHAMLMDWNTRINLTGDTRFETALTRHYLDSLAPLACGDVFTPAARVIDVGSGAGFPGLPLAIARPDMQVMLVDSLAKRVAFLRAVTQELGLSNVTYVYSRAEELTSYCGAGEPAIPLLRERFDVAVARAVAPLPVLCELLLPFVRVGGRMVCYKGPAAAAELSFGQTAARLLGGGTIDIRPMPLALEPEWRHCVLICRKQEKTDRQYPRKAGMSSRRPLGIFVPGSKKKQ